MQEEIVYENDEMIEVMEETRASLSSVISLVAGILSMAPYLFMVAVILGIVRGWSYPRSFLTSEPFLYYLLFSGMVFGLIGLVYGILATRDVFTGEAGEKSVVLLALGTGLSLLGTIANIQFALGLYIKIMTG
ncbi:MAG: hypothetical protein ACK4VW_09120 [Anaerolineales bacterium]